MCIKHKGISFVTFFTYIYILLRYIICIKFESEEKVLIKQSATDTVNQPHSDSQGAL